MENVILHSAEIPVTNFCGELTEALRQKQIWTTSLKIESHETSVTVAQSLDIQQGCFLLIVLDNSFIEILEHKKSRKLFTKISGYIAAKNTIFINHSVTEETWTELKDDLDHPNPIVIKCEESSVTDVADRIAVLTVPVSKEATESAEELGQSTASLGVHGLDSSQWTSLNPQSIQEDPLLKVRGQPEGISQSCVDVEEEEVSVPSNASEYATCLPTSETELERLSSQLAISGQDLVGPEDEISQQKAQILSQEERMACAAGNTTCNADSADTKKEDVAKLTKAESKEEKEKDNKSGNNDASTGLASSTTNVAPTQNSQTGNIPNLSVLCEGQSYRSSVGPQFSQPVMSNQMAMFRHPGGNFQNQSHSSSLGLPSSAISSHLFQSMNATHSHNSVHPSNFDACLMPQTVPSASYVTSYCRQGFPDSQNPWTSNHGDVRQYPGTCPRCGRYRDNILFFPGIQVNENLHSCSSYTSQSGPEAMCGDCFNNSRGYGPIFNSTQYVPGNSHMYHQPHVPLASVQNNQQSNNIVPAAADKKPLNTRSFEGGPHGQLSHSLPRQPYSAPVLSPFHPQNFNNVNSPVSLRPEIKRLDEQMRNVQLQPGLRYNIPAVCNSAAVHNSGSTNSDNNTHSSNSSTKSFKTCQSTQTDRKENLKPAGVMPNVPFRQHQFVDEVGPSGGNVPSNYPPDAGGASAADSYGDITLMDLSPEVMLYIQNNMDYNDSSHYNWERLATLHGWSFGGILQLRQRWHKRQIDSPFLELMGREEFQNYTLRQLREDLTKIPRKDILEKLRVFEERGELTPTKYSK